ncbi:MAG TPA: GNAT family N-acetyltransferase [Caulobacteraceae bacterium]
MAEITTRRLRLRRAAIGDLEAMHSVLSNAEAMRYWSSPPHTDLEQTRQWLAAMIAASPLESDDFVVEYAGEVIGKAGCWRIAEIGLIFHPDAWGLGLAREAASAVIERTFDLFPIEAIWADVDPRNTACLHLLEGLGFAEVRRAERTCKVGEAWCDSVYLALKRPVG